jgi:hypothetical protein
VKEIVKKKPGIKPKDIAEEIKSFPDYGKEFGGINHNEVRYILKRVKNDLDYNSCTYAFKNCKTRDQVIFLRSYGLTYIEKKKKEIKLEFYIWMSPSQLLRAKVSKHFFIDGTFDTTPSTIWNGTACCNYDK